MTPLKFGLRTKKKPAKISEELKLELALEYTSIGVWEYDSETDRVLFSDGSRQIIGVTHSNLGENPQDWNNRVHPEDKPRYFQDFQDHLNGIKPMYENEHRILCEDGTYKWIRDRGRIVEWTKNGKCKRIIGTHTDITELKANELKINNALTIASELNNRLKNFAHIVTHNLRQHTGNFESLLEFYEDADCELERQEIFKHLLTLSTSLTKTIENLNDVVSVQTSKNKRVEKINLAKEVDSILNLLDVVIQESNATIINNISDKLFITYNLSYFESIVQNLVTNAIKYKHPNRDPEITIDGTLNEENIVITVSDNGKGIDLEKFGKDIFGLYKTFHNNSDAEGVGLYLIKNQIESFGGQITVDSEIDKGTTFSIIITNKKSTPNKESASLLL